MIDLVGDLGGGGKGVHHDHCIFPVGQKTDRNKKEE
jgi:hypothetical protein